MPCEPVGRIGAAVCACADVAVRLGRDRASPARAADAPSTGLHYPQSAKPPPRRFANLFTAKARPRSNSWNIATQRDSLSHVCQKAH